MGTSAGAPIQFLSGLGESDRVRLVDLSPGQQVTATVLAVSADGHVRIGMFGARIAAFSHLLLEVGKSYRFEVAAIEPQIVLTAARPVRVPDFRSATSAGLLGAPPQQLAQPIMKLAQTLPPGVVVQPGVLEHLPRLVRALSTGVASADDLRSLHRSLGHDQEVRVLRLAGLGSNRASAEAAQLRRTLKATVLELLEPSAAQPAKAPASREMLMQLLSGLNQVESENAQRSEQSAPLYLPLPVIPGSALLDARLFLLPPPPEQDGAAEVAENDKEWSIILLLELSRLGAIRVDIKVRGVQVSVDFQVVEHESSLELRQSLGQLETELEESGLEVLGLGLRHATGSKLPVADLILPPPRASDPAARVDIHV